MWKLTLLVPMDRETQSTLLLQIKCNDRGTPPITSVENVNVVVGDINDNEPEFAAPIYLFNLLENNEANAEVGQVKASDRDVDDNGRIDYWLENKSYEENYTTSFYINPMSGIILAKKPLDREEQENYEFFVKARDNGNPRLNSTALIKVRLYLSLTLLFNNPHLKRKQKFWFILNKLQNNCSPRLKPSSKPQSRNKPWHI